MRRRWYGRPHILHNAGITIGLVYCKENITIRSTFLCDIFQNIEIIPIGVGIYFFADDWYLGKNGHNAF